MSSIETSGHRSIGGNASSDNLSECDARTTGSSAENTAGACAMANTHKRSIMDSALSKVLPSKLRGNKKR